MGLTLPLPIQFLHYLLEALQGNLGTSLAYSQPVVRVVASRLPATLILAGSSVGVAALLGVAAGMYAGLRPGTRLTQALMFLWSGLLAVPNFWLGLILVDVFAVNLHWLPAVGFGGVSALIMPVLAIAARLIALIAQVTRAEFEDLRREPFVTVARAKGLSFERVAFRHMLRPALVPILTMIGLQAGYLLGGSVVIENVFAYPGMGQLLLSAVNTRDYPLVEGITLTFVILFLALNLLVDLAYTWLDPRVRYA
jgi:ABC-type dipeptide/oligopeptide/nickel transport system permease component